MRARALRGQSFATRRLKQGQAFTTLGDPFGMCTSTEAREIVFRAMKEIYTRDKYPNVDAVVAVVQESGCGLPDGGGVDILNQLLVNTLRHPNLAAAIYLDLGCGKTCVECSVPIFQQHIRNYNQRVVNMTVQQFGGSRRTITKG